MKKVLLFLCLLTTIVLSAQTSSKSVKKTKTSTIAASKSAVISSKPAVASSPDMNSRPAESSSNYEYITTLSRLNEKEVRDFADKIAAYTAGKYVFLQIKTNIPAQYTIRYVAADVKDKEKYINQSCKECMDVRFKKGEQVYSFEGVWGKFPDLFPVWKDIFAPTAKTTDYETSDQMVMAEWKQSIGSIQVAFGRLGTAWYLVMK